MAIKGILIPDSYAVVDNISLRKKEKIFNFDFIVYEDNSKSRIIFKNNYNIDVSMPYKTSTNIYKSFEDFENIAKAIILKEYDKITDDKKNTLSDIIVLMNHVYPEIEGFYKVTFNAQNINKDEILDAQGIFIYEKIVNDSLLNINEDFFKLTDKGFVKSFGVNTNLYFENKILHSFTQNINIISTAYSVLKEIDTFYNDYEYV